MRHTSVSLLDRACNGSGPESWTRLASIYTPLLQVWLRKYALQPSDVDDLVQDVLVTVSRELPTFEHSGRTGAFRSWLRMILVHRLQNFWRSRQAQARRERQERGANNWRGIISGMLFVVFGMALSGWAGNLSEISALNKRIAALEQQFQGKAPE